MQDVKSLTDAGDFGSFGRYEEVPIAHMTPEMKEAYEYTMQLRGIVPGPHKIWLANAALSQTIVPVGGNRAGFVVAAGDPFTETLVGPSSGVWRRNPGDYGRVAYFTTDGGTAQPPDGVLRTAKVLRVTFPASSVNP
jgi:4-carboxymuconolactone decarboxylase